MKKLILLALALAWASCVQAQIVLSSTTLALAISPSANTFTLASTAGITTGTVLWVDTEAMSVLAPPSGASVTVQRGYGGTRSSGHNAGATVLEGPTAAFISYNPSGSCTNGKGLFLYSPITNISNATQWICANSTVAQSGGGGGGGGSGTVNSGSMNQLAYYPSSGTTVSGETTLQAAQMPALTGDVTSAGGTLSTSVQKVNGVVYPASPATNTVPVVTSSNQTSYESGAQLLALLAGGGTQSASHLPEFSGGNLVNSPLVDNGGNYLTTGEPLDLAQNAGEAEVANASSGTSTYSVVKLIDSSGTQQIAKTATSDTTGYGCVQSGAGTSGVAQVAWLGYALCNFDNVGITDNDYVIISPNVGGTFTDAGASLPNSGTVFGHVSGTHAACGSPPCGPYLVNLLTPDTITSGGTGAQTGANNTFTGNNSFTGKTLFESVDPWCDVNAEGADPTGSANGQQVYFADCLNLLSSAGRGSGGGGTIRACGKYQFNSTLIWTANSVRLEGCGTGNYPETSSTYGATEIFSSTNAAMTTQTASPANLSWSTSGGSLSSAHTYYFRTTGYNNASGNETPLNTGTAASGSPASGTTGSVTFGYGGIQYQSGILAYRLYCAVDADSNYHLVTSANVSGAFAGPPFLMGAYEYTVTGCPTTGTTPPSSNNSTKGLVLIQIGTSSGSGVYGGAIKHVAFVDTGGGVLAGAVHVVNAQHFFLEDDTFSGFNAQGWRGSTSNGGNAQYEGGGVAVAILNFSNVDTTNFTKISDCEFANNELALLTTASDTGVEGKSDFDVPEYGIDYAGGNMFVLPDVHFGGQSGTNQNFFVGRSPTTSGAYGGGFEGKMEEVGQAGAAGIALSQMHEMKIIANCTGAGTNTPAEACVTLDSSSSGNWITVQNQLGECPFSDGTTCKNDPTSNNIIQWTSSSNSCGSGSQPCSGLMVNGSIVAGH